MNENNRTEFKILALFTGVFALFFFLPTGNPRFAGAVYESLALAKWYAQEHVLLCLVPAFFIAGAIAVFISQASVMRYLGAGAPKMLAYGVASVSGTILAVCSCTVLPLFAGIYRMGAGLGPAVAFLYSGPAINIMAISLTGAVLGAELGIARAVGAIVFSVAIGLLMHLFFLKEEKERVEQQKGLPVAEVSRPLWQNAVFFGLLAGILVFANWGRPPSQEGLWFILYHSKWIITSSLAIGLAAVLATWMGFGWSRVLVAAMPAVILAQVFPQHKELPFIAAVASLSILLSSKPQEEPGEWLHQTWTFAKQIMPLLLWGVLAAGFFLGRPGQEGIIPSQWVSAAVGGNSLAANFFAAFAGAFMYFATLTEVPILQGLIGNGMGKGPALALLLAGPALSLPNMLVIRSVLGTRKTVVFVSLVIVMATITGKAYGTLF